MSQYFKIMAGPSPRAIWPDPVWARSLPSNMLLVPDRSPTSFYPSPNKARSALCPDSRVIGFFQWTDANDPWTNYLTQRSREQYTTFDCCHVNPTTIRATRPAPLLRLGFDPSYICGTSYDISASKTSLRHKQKHPVLEHALWEYKLGNVRIA
jgi:hypothetical protein